MIDLDAREVVGTEDDLRPNMAALIGGAGAIGLVSALSLPWPSATASTVLGAWMIAGADIDARTFLLPDLITWGATVSGVVAAALLNTADPWAALEAIIRSACTAGVLALFRGGYGWIRRDEGLGLGDVKLAAAIGAWLPVPAIPWCFGLATSSALLTVTIACLHGRLVTRTTSVPFGAFLCPALWIAFYADRVMR